MLIVGKIGRTPLILVGKMWADLTAYAAAQQRLGDLYTDEDAWSRMAAANVACSGKFSSDRAIAEYAAEIWTASPCPVPEQRPEGKSCISRS